MLLMSGMKCRGGRGNAVLIQDEIGGVSATSRVVAEKVTGAECI